MAIVRNSEKRRFIFCDNDMNELRESINKMKRKNNEHIWLAGDFNLPDIDWDLLNTKPGGVAPGLSKQLIGITNDFGLEQVVREPTRINNILDLFFTSNPTLVERSYVVPGISDHDGIPIVIISCKPRIIKQIPRKIYMYHKTDVQALKIDLMKWSDEFKLRDTSVNTVNEMFQEFQTVLESAMNSHIPTKPSSHQYSLFGHPLSKVASHTYLGVKLDSKLSWAKHITEITSKSSKVLGMVKRTLGPCKPEVKDTAYNMLVRPKLEYASPIWNPHKSSQISRLERIQHYAARFVANDHRRTTSPTTLVLTLNWQTLERRRIIKQAMTFYKILNNIIKISPPSGLLTRSHNRHHYIVPRSRLDTVVYSFYPRAIRIWNTIPKAITEISKPESFQAAISKLPFTTPIHLKCL